MLYRQQRKLRSERPEIHTVRLLLIPFVLLLGLIGVSQIHADGPNAKSYLFEGELEVDEVLMVTETVKFDTPPAELTQRVANRAPFDQSRYYVYDISETSATGAGDSTSRVEGDYMVLPMKPSAKVRITYRVTGTARSESGSNDEISMSIWRVLQGLLVGVEKVSGSLQVDAMTQLVDCTAGPPGVLEKCQLYAVGAHNSPTPKFELATRGAGEQVTFTVGFNTDQVTAMARIHGQWGLDQAFTMNLTTTGAALVTLVVGTLLLWWLHRRTDTDLVFSGEISIVGSFRLMDDGELMFKPGEGMRPGLVGIVAGEHVDPVDITATLVDPTARGHLRITGFQHTQYGLVDWQFSRLENPAGELLPYESRLLDAMTPDDGHPLVSQLPETLVPALEQVQDALYDEVVERDWSETHPDSTRSSWAVHGWIGLNMTLAIGAVLVAFAGFGLVALVLLALVISLLRTVPRIPRRTPDDTRLATALGALSALLNTCPANQMPKGRELAEISRLLPYTIVLGGYQRWLEVMAAADVDDTPDSTEVSWYHTPETWYLCDPPASLTQLVNTIQSQLFSY